MKLALLPFALAALGGCTFVAPSTAAGRLALAAAQPSPDAVSLEIFFARFRYGDARVADDLWRQVDELQLPLEARRALAEAGFRVGLVGSQPPAELVELLTLSERGRKSGEQGSRLDEDPRVNLRVLQTRAGRRNEVVASHTYASLPLLGKEGGQIVGRTFADAECRFDLRVQPQADGRWELSLAPEVHHGQPQTKYTGSEGVLRLESGKPKKTFDELKLVAHLQPGQMLLLTAAPDRPGTLGHYFFTEPVDDDVVQKLLVIRPTQATGDLLFAEKK